MLQAMWSLISKITSLWKAHQKIVPVNTVIVDQSTYARNAMLPYTLTVSRTIIHETQNSLHCFLLEVLIMYTQPLFSEKFRHSIIVSLASPVFPSSWKPAFFSPITFLGLVRCVNHVNIRCNRSNFQQKLFGPNSVFIFWPAIGHWQLKLPPNISGTKIQKFKVLRFLNFI